MKVKCAHAFKANKSEENREKTNELLGVEGQTSRHLLHPLDALRILNCQIINCFWGRQDRVFFYILLYSRCRESLQKFDISVVLWSLAKHDRKLQRESGRGSGVEFAGFGGTSAYKCKSKRVKFGKLLKFSGLHAGLDWDKKIGPGIFWSRRPTTAYDIAYTTIQSFWNSKIFNFFLTKSLCSPTLHLFNPKYSKSSNIVKYFLLFKITVFCFCLTNLFLWSKLNFQRHYSSHDRSEIIKIFWFAALSLMNRKFRRTAFIWNINIL